VAVRAATYSEPNVAVSTVVCSLEYQTTGVDVEKVEDTGNGSSTNHIMEEIGINVGGGNNQVAAGGRAILWNCFMGTCVAGVKLVKFLLRDV